MISNWAAALLFLAVTLALGFWLEFRSLKHGSWRRQAHHSYELRDLQEEMHARREEEKD